MENSSELETLLMSLADETGDSKTYKIVVETLFLIHRNIFQSPKEITYRKLKFSNSKFAFVWKFRAARKILQEFGWKVNENEIILEDTSKVHEILKCLENYRLVAPAQEEWFSGNKLEFDYEKVKEEKEMIKKKKAIAKRDKDLSECLKDKEERKQLGAQIKQQIKSDNIERKSLFHYTSKSNPNSKPIFNKFQGSGSGAGTTFRRSGSSTITIQPPKQRALHTISTQDRGTVVKTESHED